MNHPLPAPTPKGRSKQRTGRQLCALQHEGRQGQPQLWLWEQVCAV